MVVIQTIKILSDVHKALAQSAINFIGMGVSGGEIGALTGPSLMPVDKKKLITKLQIS